MTYHAKIALRERNLGRLQGLTDEEFKEKYPDDFGKYKINGFDKELFGGESFRELYERSIECFIELADKNKNGNILIVIHGGNLECIFRWVFEIPLDKKRQFSLKNCSINRFFIIDGNWKLDIWGEVVF